MDYEALFRAVVDRIRGEGRCRVFAELQRQVGRYPTALRHNVRPRQARPARPALPARAMITESGQEPIFREH